MVSNSAGSATSAAATLTVNAAVVAPAITTQPVSQTVTAGANVTFTVAASGTTPLSYQWQKDSANLAGATSATLTLNGVTSANAGSYRAVVSNSAGSATSAAATLAINAAPVAPAITMQPLSQTVTAGANVTFMVGANGTAPLSYQWKKNGANIVGATGPSVVRMSVSSTDAGSYTVQVSNSAGSVTSAPATLTVNPAPVVLSIALTSPTNGATMVAPANVPLAATVSPATGIASVQFFDGTNLAGIVTAAPYSMTLSNVPVGDHVLTAKVTDNEGDVAASAPVTITVSDVPGTDPTPVVRIVSPEDGAAYRALARIMLAAQATVAAGSVEKVEFYLGSRYLGTGVPSSTQGEVDDDGDDDPEHTTLYLLSWNRVRIGQYVITAKVTDNLGQVSYSAPINVTVRSRSSWSTRD